MKGVPNSLVVALALMALACSNASAYDPAPLQDFCVAINTSTEACMYTLSSSSYYYYYVLLESFDASGFFFLILGTFVLKWAFLISASHVINHYYQSVYMVTLTNFVLCSICEWKVLQ